ncbi:hypothetical protein ACS0TY_022078 [Phlomoides rotata]
MAEQEEEENPTAMDEPHKLKIPTRRVKNIMKLDKDINRVNSEALFLVASSTELFLQFLVDKSASVAMEKKKRTVRSMFLSPLVQLKLSFRSPVRFVMMFLVLIVKDVK